MDRKYKYLTKNISLFAISSFGPKILAFLMVPLYTSCLSTAEYGVADIISTTVHCTLPIIIACIDQGVLRFSLDKAYDVGAVYSNSLAVLLRGLLVAAALSVVAAFIPLPFDTTYILFFMLYLVANAAYSFQVAFCRGIDRVGVMVEMSLITTAATCLLNILFLPVLELGVNGFMIANFSGMYLAVIWGTVRLKSWRYFDRATLSKPLSRELVSYSFPLALNQSGWWISSSIDKYIVVGMLGAAENGVLSVSYKIPTVLSTIAGIFGNAFTISAIKEYDPEDSDGFVINTYNTYNAAIVICCAGLMILNIPLAYLLYAGEFFVAWRYTGPLLISAVFAAMADFVGSLCAAAKDTKIYTISTVIGGIANVILSILFVRVIGAMSVVIGTALANFLMWLIRLIRTRRYVKLRINYLRDAVAYILLIAEFVVGLFGFSLITVSIQTAILLVILLLNKSVLAKIFGVIKNKLTRGRN